jgi:hypothetical protein
MIILDVYGDRRKRLFYFARQNVSFVLGLMKTYSEVYLCIKLGDRSINVMIS